MIGFSAVPLNVSDPPDARRTPPVRQNPGLTLSFPDCHGPPWFLSLLPTCTAPFNEYPAGVSAQLASPDIGFPAASAVAGCHAPRLCSAASSR
jgi:hypothetical protein